MSKDKPTQRVTIYLLASHIKDPPDAFTTDTNRGFGLNTPSVNDLGTLYVDNVNPHPPAWAAFLEPAFSDAVRSLRNQSSHGILFVKASKRLFALTFGYSRHLLREESFEPDFGLKVTLNSVDRDKLRSVDAKTFDELPRTSRVQTGQLAPVEMFGLDVDHDLLHAVAGQPRNSNFATRVAGSDALCLTGPMDLYDVQRFCEEALRLYQLDDYKADYPWVDNVRRLRNDALVVKLDELLVFKINSAEMTGIRLAPPRLMEWSDPGLIRYSCQDKNSHDCADFDIFEYLHLMNKPKKLTVEDLKKHSLSVRFASSDHAEVFKVYRCVDAEFVFDGKTYVLTGGNYYVVDDQYAAKVISNFKNVVSCNLLPKPQRWTQEDEYNLHCSNCLSGSALLDKKTVIWGPTNTPIEICDILTPQQHFIHVKRDSQSSKLSHLFNQGLVSAQAFSRDRDYRQRVKDKLTELSSPLSHMIEPDKRPERRKWNVVYAVMLKNRRDLQECVPFFSKVVYRTVSQRLEDMGYNVYMDTVHIQ
jgi:uncharacterized protein (TIGR04141 family)